MIITNKVEKMVTVEETVALMCNKCGELIELERSYTLHNFDINFGFGANDNQNWKFDMCNTCITELVSGFKVEPDKTSDEASDWEWPTDDWKQEEEPVIEPRPNTLEPFRYV